MAIGEACMCIYINSDLLQALKGVLFERWVLNRWVLQNKKEKSLYQETDIKRFARKNDWNSFKNTSYMHPCHCRLQIIRISNRKHNLGRSEKVNFGCSRQIKLPVGTSGKAKDITSSGEQRGILVDRQQFIIYSVQRIRYSDCQWWKDWYCLSIYGLPWALKHHLALNWTTLYPGISPWHPIPHQCLSNLVFIPQPMYTNTLPTHTLSQM